MPTMKAKSQNQEIANPKPTTTNAPSRNSVDIQASNYTKITFKIAIINKNQTYKFRIAKIGLLRDAIAKLTVCVFSKKNSFSTRYAQKIELHKFKNHNLIAL